MVFHLINHSISKSVKTYDNRADDKDIEHRPHTLVEEPLISPHHLEHFLYHHVRKSDIIQSGNHHHHNDDIPQLQEDLQLGGLFPVLQVLESFQECLENPKVNKRVH